MFAGAYWAGRIILMVGAIVQGREAISPSIISVSVICPAIMIGAFLDNPAREIIWAIALIAEFLTPRMQVRKLRLVRYDVEHVMERFGLLVLLALGESIVAIIEPLIDTECLHRPTIIVMAAAFVLVTTLWWVCFHHSNHFLVSLMENAKNQVDVVSFAASFGHLATVGGIIGVSAALEEAMAEPHEELHGELGLLLVFGIVLVLAVFVVVRAVVFHRPYISRIVAIVVLCASLPVVLHISAYLAVLAIAVAMVVLCIWETLAPHSAGIPGEHDFAAVSGVDIDE